uniref:Component of oligomeric Golgi complex 4 n=1 Tax=Schistosoma mansoni TaxID=6183 RepID=A0A5K4F4K6_SCHMA
MIGPNSLARYHFLVTLNSIEASQKNLLSLVNHLESELNLLYQNQEINSQKLNEDLDVFAANDRWIESCIAHTEDFLRPFRVLKFDTLVIFYNHTVSVTVAI